MTESKSLPDKAITDATLALQGLGKPRVVLSIVSDMVKTGPADLKMSSELLDNVSKVTQLAQELSRVLDSIQSAPEVSNFKQSVKKWKRAVDILPDKILRAQDNLDSNRVRPQNVEDVLYWLEHEKLTLRQATEKLALVSDETIKGVECNCCNCKIAKWHGRRGNH